MATNDGGSAFPFHHKYDSGDARESDGMSLRDYFAGRAPYMPDELLGQAMDDIAGVGRQAELKFLAALFAKWAYEFADAMLRQRKEPEL